MKKIEYAHMLLHEFREALENRPVAYLPIGPMEWHGDHLPLGTDLLRATHICTRLATELGGILLPGWILSCRGYSSFEGTMIFAHETAVTTTLELLQQLEKVGFKATVLLSAHGGGWQQAFISEVENRHEGKMAVLGMFPRMASGRGGHAGTSEASEMMAVDERLVDLSQFKFPENPIRQYDVDPELLCPAETKPWVWNDDLRLTASAEMGHENHDKIVAYCGEWLQRHGV